MHVSAKNQNCLPPDARIFLLACLCFLALSAKSDETPRGLTGGWGARASCESNGVAPFAELTAEVWGNTSGGLRTGGRFNQLLDFGLELDTAKLGWWDGGSFLVQGRWVEHLGAGSCFEEYTGAFNPVSSIMARDQIRVFNLYYRHAWGEDAAVLKLGQLAVDDDFMGSDYAGLFLNSAFGAMPSQVGTPLATSCGSGSAFPMYPVAAPGMFFKVRPLKSIYTQLGLYCGKPGSDEPGNHGFNWATEASQELGLFWESGYEYRLAQHAGTVRFGLTYHTGPRDDFRAPATGNCPVVRQAVPNYFVVNDFQLLADHEGKMKLGVFCRGGFTPEPQLSMVGLYADGGLNWFAPLPGRPDDTAGVAVSYTQFGSAFRNHAGPDGFAAAETTLEVTYRAQVNRRLMVQADLQLLFDPAENPSSLSRETAVVLGLRTVIVF